ncbi:uncharacterized protein LOC127283822 [Leptopilina boulardi]|uniref:uncharacterized protein LOC127283822 n=1 Tax=Leptopilina boulardi TaxID=63433 RepID=UPI0021F63B55|nr:uncharacterized protein LOC127283822 [Leptopilina boulardi]
MNEFLYDSTSALKNERGRQWECDEDGVIIEEDTFEYFETKVISVMKRIEFNQDLSMKETQDVQVLLDSNIISNLAFLDSSNELLESPTNQSNLLNKHSSGNQFSKRNELDSEIQESQLVQFNLKEEIESIPGGIEIIEEYNKSKDFDTRSRRQLVNITVQIMLSKCGQTIPKSIKMQYANELVKLFPTLKDKYSEYGYEAFFNPKTGLGFFTYRIKTVNRNTDGKKGKPKTVMAAIEINENIPLFVSEEELQENLNFIQTADPKTRKEEIVKAMKVTFSMRRNNSIEILNKFPRFLDTPGLINLDFSLMHPNLQMKNFPSTQILEIFGKSTSSQEAKKKKTDADISDWSEDIQAVLTLLKQLPPSSRGRKKDISGPVADNPHKLITFSKACFGCLSPY